MPVKAEKEPIRHLYEEYNRVKDMLVSSSASSGGGEVPETSRQGHGGEEGNERTSLGSGNHLHKLKVEKASLHQKLRAYEKEFVRNEGRQVSSFQDIKPVAGLYRRYKEIKKLSIKGAE